MANIFKILGWFRDLVLTDCSLRMLAEIGGKARP